MAGAELEPQLKEIHIVLHQGHHQSYSPRTDAQLVEQLALLAWKPQQVMLTGHDEFQLCQCPLRPVEQLSAETQTL